MNDRQWDRLADTYHEEVVSPFYGRVKNPLFRELRKIRHKDKKTVAEFGCGLFYLGKILANDFRKVHASDFSSKMVRLAKKNNKDYINVNIRKEDITKVNYRNKFDVVLSINSIIMPSYKKIMQSLNNIHISLKKGGTLLMILPSMDSVLYHGMLLLHQELAEKRTKAARKNAKRKFEHSKYDYFLGHYKDGKDIQKFYYYHEIGFLLKKAGFGDIKISKVKYPWGKDISDYEKFPDEEPLWDWFVKARK